MGYRMSKFLSSLDAELIQDCPPTWRLTSELIYQSDIANRVIVAPIGFITDLASVPRIPFAYWACGGCANEAAVVHDYLYTSHIVSRSVADEVLREAAAITGVPWWKRMLFFAAVRVFGGSHWKPIEHSMAP
jgi:hypothetical protein